MIAHDTLPRLEEELTTAICPEAVFGALGDEPIAGLAERYRRLARACHPDLVATDDKPLAEELFRRLGEWRHQAERKLATGRYGDNRPPLPECKPLTVTVGARVVTLTAIEELGLISTIYTASLHRLPTRYRAIAKVVRHPADNDLIEREFQALTAIREPAPDPEAEAGFFAPQRRYLPEPLAHFTLQESDGRQFGANLLATPMGRCFTGAQLRRQHFPHGIEPRQVWWIVRRLLLTLWLAHLRGFAHGAVTPDHVLIYPDEHGLVLLDWTTASRLGEQHVPLLNPEYADFYPPEVHAKAPAQVATDLFMAARTAHYLLGEHAAGIAAPLARFLQRCQDDNPSRRPQDAERAHEELGALLGKREFSAFIVP